MLRLTKLRPTHHPVERRLERADGPWGHPLHSWPSGGLWVLTICGTGRRVPLQSAFNQCVDEGKEEHHTCSRRECAKGAHGQTAADGHAAHLLVAGGGDARFCLLLPAVLVLRLPEPSLTKEALMQFQLITSLLPAHTALHVQPVDVDCDVLNVFRRNPSPGNIQRCRQKLPQGCWTPRVVKDNLRQFRFTEAVSYG